MTVLRILSRFTPLIALLPLAIVVFVTLPGDFIRGAGEYWSLVMSDRAQALAGYLYFASAPWSSDLLFIPTLSIPEGDRLINADSIVIVSLAGKLYHSLSGVLLNPYGLWYVFCWLMNGLAAVLIMRQQQVSDLPRLVAVALIVGLVPFWLARWYHFSLVAHFLVLLSFHAYLVTGRGKVVSGLLYLLSLSLLAALVHIYLWCMVMIIMGATVLHIALEQKRFSVLRLGAGAVAVLVSIGFVYLAGYLELSGSSENTGYMSYSTNLLSPFYSNHSAFSLQSWALLEEARADYNAWPFFAGQKPDATGSQYMEGMAYPGAGAWLLVIFAAAVSLRKSVPGLIRRHPSLLGVSILAFAFAVTPYLTFGAEFWQIWQPGETVLAIAGALRASGRFFWIPGYLIIIAAMVLTCRNSTRTISTAVLVCAAILQLVDTTPIRRAVALDAGHGKATADNNFWNRRLPATSRLIILPSYECGTPETANLKSFLQTRAAWLGPVPTNSASQSRATKNCAAEFGLLKPDAPHDGTFYVFFDEDGEKPETEAFIAAHKDRCERFSAGTACLLAQTPMPARGAPGNSP